MYKRQLAALVEDEMDLGVTVIDMGGGTTSLAVFFEGQMVYCDSVPVGGQHITNDIARGLSTPIAHAAVSYTHLRAHETSLHLVCRLLLKKNFFFFNDTATTEIYTLHIVGSVRCV